MTNELSISVPKRASITISFVLDIYIELVSSACARIKRARLVT